MTGKGFSEAATRRDRIDKQLGMAGWRVAGTDFETEYEVGSEGETDHGFSDYLLPSDDGLPLGIVEAKRSSRDAVAGKEQARLYADAIEQRTGRRPFIFLANGDEIWFVDGVGNPRRVAGFFRRADLEARRFRLTERRSLATTAVKTSIVERPFQHEAVRRVQEAFTDGKRKALLVMATGTGKTRTAIALVDTLQQARWVERVLFLVDRRTLAKQAIDAFVEHIPSEPAEWITAPSYNPHRRIYVATLQTMQDFYETFSPGEFDLIISDEAHRSIYSSWEAILTHFDALLLGLTATPADFVDRNTFEFFGCEQNVPTFSYEYERAVAEGYLVPFQVYHARTQIQIGGIHGSELPADVQAKLHEEGIEPEDIDFAGTELERKVTNRATTRLLVQEFFENCLKEPGSNLPGKSIVFAMSHAHAMRLWETFNSEYPQFVGMAEVIDSQMERTESLIERLKRESLPRVAISVDMLDTGIDIPSIVNLAFLKPVFSRIKFWQMIGRGTRLIDAENTKPWCPVGSKPRFRILDFWENFQRFQMNPEGVDPSTASPVAVRNFRVIVRVAKIARDSGREDLAMGLESEARAMIHALPIESAGVRERRRLISDVSSDRFWRDLSENKIRLLNLEVAPLMRFLAGADLSGQAFSSRCLEVISQMLIGAESRAHEMAAGIRDDVLHLPIDHPDLEYVSELIHRVSQRGWPATATLDDVLEIRSLLTEHMTLRLPEPQHVITLDLTDAFQEQRWIVVGPEAKEFDVGAYRTKVEARVRELAGTNSAFQKLAGGRELTDQDLAEMESTLNRPDLYMTEDTLRKAYEAPEGSLVNLLKNALGLESLPGREGAVRKAFEAFIAEKAYLEADRIRFVRLFCEQLISRGRVQLVDLYNQPYLMLGNPDTLLPGTDLEALFELASRYEKAA